MPSGDQHSAIRLAQDLGAIKQGVKTLDEGQREVDRKITGLQRSVASLVTKEDCRLYRSDLADRIKKPSGASRPHLAVQGRPALLETAGRKAAAIAAILALFSMIFGGIVVLSRFVGQVEQTLKAGQQEQAKRTTQMLQELRQPRAPIVIQQHVPVLPDAGPRRRRRRRKRSSQ